MSANKYANLPDIDTSQDVYETEDVFPTSRQGAADSSEDEAALPRHPPTGQRNKGGELVEGVDSSSFISADDASKKFKKSERHHGTRPRSIYAFPPSTPPSPTSGQHGRSLGTRLRALQAELDELEVELADPTNPLLQEDDESSGTRLNPGDLMRGLVDVRGRLEKVKKDKEGRGRLVGVILGQDGESQRIKRDVSTARSAVQDKPDKEEDHSVNIVELDRRINELEGLIGSSSVTVDETSPLPAPLLPLLTKLNTQLTLLTQPRHLDSISRRLKLLISDLDRLSTAQHAHGNKKQSQQATQAQTQSAPTPLQEQMLPLLARLAPNLPHLPHLLTRMRTLSSLHTAAADAQGILSTLEGEQRQTKGRLDVLTAAVEGVEKSLEENADVMKANVGGLEERIEALLKRLDALNA